MDKIYISCEGKEYVLSQYRPEFGKLEIVFKKDGWIIQEESLIDSIRQLDILGKDSFNVRIKDEDIETFKYRNEIYNERKVFVSNTGKTRYCPTHSIIFVLDNKDRKKDLELFTGYEVSEEIKEAPIYLIDYRSNSVYRKYHNLLKDKKSGKLPDWIKEIEINLYTYEKEYLNKNEGIDVEAKYLKEQKAYERIYLKTDDGKRKYFGSGDIKIAVFDLGVDKNHDDIKKAVPEKDFGYDCVTESNSVEPDEQDHHGTKCAGLIIGTSDGINGVEGVAQQCMLLDYRIGYVRHGEKVRIHRFGIIKAIYMSVFQQGADVINCSWGDDSPSPTINYALKDVIERGRNYKGTIVVAAAGNGGVEVAFPANMREVIGVTAVNENNEPKIAEEDSSWQSNYGEGADIAAPGTGLVTTKNWRYGKGSEKNYEHNFFGTSAAAPLVSGVVGLLLSIKKGAKAQYVREILTDEDNLTKFSLGVLPSKNYGNGILNVEKVINSILN